MSIRRLVKLFRTSNPRLRSKLALCGGRYLQYNTFLQSRLDDRDDRVRANLIESLWTIHGGTARKILLDAATDTNPRVRTNALLGLCLIDDPDGRSALIEQAKHVSAEFRAAAAWAMGETKDAAFLDVLSRLARADPEVHVRTRAATSLTRLEPILAPDSTCDTPSVAVQVAEG